MARQAEQGLCACSVPGSPRLPAAVVLVALATQEAALVRRVLREGADAGAAGPLDRHSSSGWTVDGLLGTKWIHRCSSPPPCRPHARIRETCTEVTRIHQQQTSAWDKARGIVANSQPRSHCLL